MGGKYNKSLNLINKVLHRSGDLKVNPGLILILAILGLGVKIIVFIVIIYIWIKSNTYLEKINAKTITT